MNPPTQTKPSVCVVFGATGSVGRGAAMAFAQLPSTTVYIVGRNADALHQVHQSALGGAPNVVPIVADASTAAGAAAARAAIGDENAKITHVVSCSGPRWSFPPLPELEPERWDEAMQSNVNTHFYIFRNFIASVTESYVIVNCSSMSNVPFSGVTGVCAAAVHSFALLATASVQHVRVHELLMSSRVCHESEHPAPAVMTVSKCGRLVVAAAQGIIRRTSGLIDGDDETLKKYT